MNPCSWTVPLVSFICAGASAATSAVAGSFWSSAAQMFASAQAEMLKLLFTAWLGIPTPQLSGNGSVVDFLQQDLSGYVAFVATIGLMVAGIRLMLEQRHDAAVRAGTAVLRTIIIVGAGAIGISLFSALGDSFSTWIVGQAAGGANVAQTLTTDSTLGGVASPGVILLLAPLSMLGSLIQIALLLCRSAFLVILAGIWPIAAAASSTEDGLMWYRRVTGWIVAFLLFKPAAGIIYAAALKLLSGGNGSELDAVEGCILIVLACLALPALLRLVVPMTQRMGGIGTAEVLGTAVGVAAGAAMVAGSGGIGALAGGASAKGASGAAGGGPGGGPGGGTGGGPIGLAGGHVGGPGGGAGGGGGGTGQGHGPKDTGPTGAGSGGESSASGGAEHHGNGVADRGGDESPGVGDPSAQPTGGRPGGGSGADPFGTAGDPTNQASNNQDGANQHSGSEVPAAGGTIGNLGARSVGAAGAAPGRLTDQAIGGQDDTPPAPPAPRTGGGTR